MNLSLDAAAVLPEDWIVDVTSGRMRTAAPHPKGITRHAMAGRDRTAAPLAIPDAAIAAGVFA